MKTEAQKKAALLLSFLVLGCVLMAIVEQVWQPGYAIKSAAKVITFTLLPLLYARVHRDSDLGSLFRFTGAGLRSAALFGGLVFGIIVGAYLLLRPTLDLSGIPASLETQLGIDADNFIWVALYITLANSLLEEFFFRGFGYLILRRYTDKAGVWSALLFALYHVSIFGTWFSPSLMALCLAGLLVAGYLFQMLDQRAGSLYPSWSVHLCANLALNGIGFVLLS